MRKPFAILCAVLFAGCGASDEDDSLPMPAPKSVQITSNNEALVLQWTRLAPAQGVYPEYDVYYSDAANAGGALHWERVPSPDSKLVTSTITSLENLKTYYVWITADYGSIGKSKLEGDPTGSGMPMPPPSKLTGFTIIPSEEMLELKWDTEKSGNITIPFNFDIAYIEGASGADSPPEGATQITAPENGFILSGLTNNQTYTVWARASNTSGKSSYVKSTGTPAVASAAPGDAPKNVEAEAGDGKLILRWSQVSGVPKYKIYYNTSDSPGGEQKFPDADNEYIPASAPAVSAELTGLSNNSTYSVRVKSANSKGESDYSNAASGNTTPKEKPAIEWSNTKFELGKASAEFIYAQDLPPSPFFPEGRPNTDRITRVQEAALANLFTDGAAWYVRNKKGKTVDFAFLNGGYIDNVLSKGTITVGTVTGVIDPDSRSDKLVIVNLSGSQLKKFFDEVAYSATHSGRGGPPETAYFGQVSKEIRYTLQYADPPSNITDFDNPPDDVSKEEADKLFDACEHGRIKDDTLQIYRNGSWKDIADGETYRMLTTDYNASGIFYQTITKESPGVSIESVGGELFWHTVASYIYDKGTVTPLLGDGSSPSARRIKIEGGVPLPADTGWVKSGIDANEWIAKGWDVDQTAPAASVLRSASARYRDEH